MCSYNAINGIPACADRDLLYGTARGGWGFEGYITSDCGAIDTIIYNHHYTNDTDTTAMLGVKATCDLDCGGFYQLIPSMHKAGIDSVQSLQPVNDGMLPANLKKNYGDQMIFNGAIDSINRLIYGTKEQCIETTKEVVSIMKPGGGYILSPSHDYLLEMTPVENVLAMYDTCLECGGY